MDWGIKMEQMYLGIPIQTEQPEETLEIFSGKEKLFEFQVPVCKDAAGIKYDYYSYLNMEPYIGQELILRGDFSDKFFADICQKQDNHQEPLARPLLHFTAERGWINDPNGLVYHDGRYHLYYQHNPMNTQWKNMTWGHAVSGDLLHFEQMDMVLYPDEDGAVFSGCGIVNNRGLLGLSRDALLFCYSAAGDTSLWSRGKAFVQKLAYSTDGGRTLVKLPAPAIGVIGRDTRDPKIFWHEDSQAYIMVLWIRGNEFGIFRSENLKDWTQSDSLTLEGGWECPDMFCLECEGTPVWVFTSAAGFYWLGEFDGYQFRTDGVRKKAYMTDLTYAAQTYSGVKGRTVSVPWLRTLNAGQLYTGMMGLPRELGLVRQGDELLLTMVPVREYDNAKREEGEFTWGAEAFFAERREEAVTELELRPREFGGTSVHFFGEELHIRENVIIYKGERTVLPGKPEEIRIIIDREILELYINKGTVNACYETELKKLRGKIRIEGGQGTGKLFVWQP